MLIAAPAALRFLAIQNFDATKEFRILQIPPVALTTNGVLQRLLFIRKLLAHNRNLIQPGLPSGT